MTQIQPVLISKKVNVRESGNINTWKLGDAITEAKELRITPDGRIMLSTTDNNLPKPQRLTCY